jgi:DNA invertase Pin-like site-specific DNA recombinase
MNAIIYIRVSTTEQAELGYSLKTQEQQCRDYAIRNKYDILKIFIEKGESAKTVNRTELNNMLEYARTNKNKIDVLIIHKMDRLSRNMFDSLSIRITLDKYSIALKSVTEPFDNSPIGTFTSSIFSLIAQLDNDTRAQRTKQGMQQAVREGRWLWPKAFGYIYKYINQKSYLTPSDDAGTVKKIFKDFISGKKQFEICDDLSKCGIKMSKQHLNGILRNYIYIGKLKTKLFDELIDGVHEPIIDEITFYKAQNILNPISNKTYGLTYNDEFPLKRFLKCPYCNRNLAGSYSKGRHKRYPYYHCVNKGCTFKPIRQDLADYQFIQYLKSFEIKKDVIDKIFDDTKSFLEDKQGENKNIIVNIKRDITAFEAKKTRIIDLAIDGTFDKETYQDKINEFNAEIIAKKILLSDYEAGILNIDELVDYGKRFVCNLSSLWLNLDTPKKRHLQEVLFPEGLILENGEFRTAKISPILRLIQEQNDLKNDSQSIMAAPRGFEPI